MSGTRPIPISHRSQRSSPLGAANDANAGVSPNGMISQSCPVNNNGAGGGAGAAYFHQRPPRAPVIGSLPEPSFMLGGGLDGNHDIMPELILPPPAQFESAELSSSHRREASVVQVASSCPGDIGFFRHGFPASAEQRSWAPSPRASDEFDLSKSPALAVMSAMRQARRPSFDEPLPPSQLLSSSYTHTQQRHHTQLPPPYGIPGTQRISDAPFRPQPSNSFISSSHHFFGDTSRNSTNHDYREEPDQPDQLAMMESLSLGGGTTTTTTGTMTTTTAATASENGLMMGLPPRRPERRGSYDGGIFHFEDSD